MTQQENNTSDNRNAQINEYVVEVEDREWTVIPKEDSEYIVQYPEKDKSQVVNLDEKHCTGTYFQYNDSCTHLRACQEVQEQIQDNEDEESEEEQSGGIGRGDAVYCRICDRVHAGKCDFQKSGDVLWTKTVSDAIGAALVMLH